MVGKKGQFTIFVVLGIVIVAAILFALFARSFYNKQFLLSEAENNVEEALKINNINFYVESCLDRTSEDAIYLISLQGGRIYEFQNGSWPNPIIEGKDFINYNLTQSYVNVSFYNNSNISYAIIPNYNNTCIITSPPDYPFKNAYLDMLKKIYHNNSILKANCTFDTGTVGTNALPKLCDPNGSNRLNATGGTMYNNTFFNGRCIFGYGPLSVQEQLEHYTENKMKECVDLSIFYNLGSNITVAGDISVDYTFIDNYFLVQANYPLDVRVKGRNVRTIAEFETKKNLRFKKTYEFIQRILEQEYKDIFFNIESDYKNTSLGWDSGIKLVRIPNVCKNCIEGQYDDLFQLIDEGTKIRGNPLIFHLLIKNRAPILDYIDMGQKYNIAVKEGEVITITPLGIDPDEHLIEYDYTGWKENFTAWFDETSCINNIVDCQEHPENYVNNVYVSPHNWTDSILFNNTRQNASYKTNRSDLGLHFTEVWIRDGEGQFDFQNVSIMVFDVPQINPSADNNYSDIGNHNASIEDPYTLDAQVVSIFTNVIQFQWFDPDDPFNIFLLNPLLTIPNPITNYDINNIKSGNFWNTGLRIMTVKGEYYYQSGTVWTPDEPWLVDVHQCLPHRDTGASYPYNEVTGNGIYNSWTIEPDPFQADHTCCSNSSSTWGQRLGTSKECYDYTEWSSYETLNSTRNKFVTNDFEQITDISKYNPAILESNIKYQLNPISEKNDIWKRKLTRNCDITRGNMCNGTVDIQINSDIPCNYDFSFDEQCSGPPALAGFSNTPLSCVDYWGETYEGEFEGGSGSCNYIEKCSFKGPNGYDKLGGNFYCNETCSGNGECNLTNSNTCYDCRNDEFPATDPEESMGICGNDGDCPKIARNCLSGGGANCNNFLNGCYAVNIPIINVEECKNCPGPSGTCYFEEYYPRNANGIGPAELCQDKSYSPDDYQEICEQAPGCAGNGFVWYGGNTGDLRCCGDDWECINQDTFECIPNGGNTIEFGILKNCLAGVLS